MDKKKPRDHHRRSGRGVTRGLCELSIKGIWCMQTEFYNKIKAGLSAPRIESYRQDGVEEVVALARYLLNSKLSEALYTPLQHIEICLRNEIDRVVSSKYGSDWLSEPSAFLDSRDCRQIELAKTVLRRSRYPVEHDRLIAELSFGFWTTLLDKRYERSLWQGLLKEAFPHMPKSDRTRKNLSARFNKIRRLRNRIFHHERIVHWKDLTEQHNGILEAIDWINPGIGELTRKLDSFTAIYSAGIEPWKSEIRQHWPKQ